MRRIALRTPLEGVEQPYRLGPSLDEERHQWIRRQMALEHCKWDMQVGDDCTLLPFPLLITDTEWSRLAHWAEQLSRETLTAEQELLHRPELHERLGLPRPIRNVLAKVSALGATPPPGRILRFDFHWTTEGWRISEVNSDVPGGFSESTSFGSLMEQALRVGRSPGAPAETWCDVLARAAGPRGTVALLSAPGFLEDAQIVAYLARRLEHRGCRTFRTTPSKLRWEQGHARTANGTRVDLVVRFYQAEWLTRWPRAPQWSFYFCGGKTPVANAGASILTETKRFPLVWSELDTPLDTWRALLPQTRGPGEVKWDESWVLKGALCNTGDEVVFPPLPFNATHLMLRLAKESWVAQRRFTPVPIDSPVGPLYPCVGVYTINGRVAGAYVRAARKLLVDYSALELALLVEGKPQ